VAKQVQKEYDCNNDMMAEYLAEVRMIEKFFDEFEVRYVPCFGNHDVDQLAWIASFRAPTPLDAIVEKLFKPSVKPKESISKAGPELMIIDEPAQQQTYDWMSLIKAYLNNQPPSDDNAKVKHIAHKFKIYHLIDGALYRQGVPRGRRLRPALLRVVPVHRRGSARSRLPLNFIDEAVELTSVSELINFVSTDQLWVEFPQLEEPGQVSLLRRGAYGQRRAVRRSAGILPGRRHVRSARRASGTGQKEKLCLLVRSSVMLWLRPHIW
jgi:hypothetical protein